MEFLEINGSAIARERLLAVRHHPKVDEGVVYSPEHYQAVFDTGQELRLTPEEGAELVQRLNGSRKPPNGTTAITSSELI